jgi:hypothetical protein
VLAGSRTGAHVAARLPRSKAPWDNCIPLSGRYNLKARKEPAEKQRETPQGMWLDTDTIYTDTAKRKLNLEEGLFTRPRCGYNH